MGEALKGLDADLGALVAGTAKAYAVYWGTSLSYSAAELKLTTPLRNPRLQLVTILDALATIESGTPVVVETKTTSSTITPGSWYFEKLTLDLQASTYLWAARKHGHPVEHVVWDAIKRPYIRRRTEATEPEYYQRNGKGFAKGDLKPGTGIPVETIAEFADRVSREIAEQPSTYFQRCVVVRLDDELEAAMEDVEQLGTQILYAIDNNAWPKNPANCLMYGQRCSYWEICSGAATPSDTALYQPRRRREP